MKDGLVCDNNTGRLVGYTNINIDKDLDHMQVNKNKIAIYVLVFMMRSLKSNFNPAAATYEQQQQLQKRFWELVSIVELLGLNAHVKLC